MIRTPVVMPIVYCVAIVLVLQMELHAQATLRTWRIAYSDRTVEAEFVGVVGERVRIRKADGKSVLVDLNQLSLRDLKYIKNFVTDPNSLSLDPKLPVASTELEPTIIDADVTVLGPNEVPKLAIKHNVEDVFTTNQPSVWYGFFWREGLEQKLQIGNLRTGQVFNEFAITGPHDKPKFALSPEGSMVALTNSTNTTIYTRDGKKLCEIPDFNSGHVSFLTTQELAVLSDREPSASHIYNPVTGKIIRSLAARTASISKSRISPSGNSMVGAPSILEIAIYDLASGQLKCSKKSYPFTAECFNYSRDATQVAALGTVGGSELCIFDSQTLDEVRKYSLKITVPRNLRKISTPTLESLDGNKYWMLFGRYLVDSSVGAVVWTNSRSEDESNIRIGMIDDQRMLWMNKNNSECTFAIQAIPWSEF